MDNLIAEPLRIAARLAGRRVIQFTFSGYRAGQLRALPGRIRGWIRPVPKS